MSVLTGLWRSEVLPGLPRIHKIGDCPTLRGGQLAFKTRHRVFTIGNDLIQLTPRVLVDMRRAEIWRKLDEASGHRAVSIAASSVAVGAINDKEPLAFVQNFRCAKGRHREDRAAGDRNAARRGVFAGRFLGCKRGLFLHIPGTSRDDEPKKKAQEATHQHHTARTFRARDVFSPVAARLADGLPIAAVGSPVALDELERLELRAARLHDPPRASGRQTECA